jgi:hypothetical protein
MSWGSVTRSITAVLAVILACGGAAATLVAAEPEALDFVRVHVPAERLSDVPLGTGRYVPMTLAEFRAALADRDALEESATAALGSLPSRTVIADEARYTLTWSPSEGFRGTAEVVLGPGIGGLRRAIPLAGHAVSQATFSSGAGTGAADICGLPDGSVAVIAESEGNYGWQFTLPTTAQGQLGPAFRLPLVPAVFTSVEMRIPTGYVPMVKGAEAVLAADQSVDAPPAGARADSSPSAVWQFDLGPTRELSGAIAVAPLPEVPLSCWSEISVQRQSCMLTTTIEPATPWATTRVRLGVDPGVAVVAVTFHDDDHPTTLSWTSAVDDDEGPPSPSGLLVQLPHTAVGTRGHLVIESISAFDAGASAKLPAISPPAELWAGGGLVLVVDPRLVVEQVQPAGYVVVDDANCATWPIDIVPESTTGSLMAFEAQASDAALQVTLSPREPAVEVQRVTTVDISAGSVIAQAAFTVAVAKGEIFELVGDVAPGWLIDSVEIPSRADRPDWRVEPSARGSKLRIGLVNGVVDGGEIRVNVMGHRGPLREGEPFSQSSLEMLQLSEERMAALEIRTNAEMTIDGAGEQVESVGLEALPTALRGLAGDAGVRLRLLSTARGERRMLRLLRRRPPIDVQTQVRLTVRDDRLTESFTLECAPRDAEIDSVVVHFSEPTGDGMEWSLLPPTAGQLLARRLQPQEPRDPSHGMESWLLEFFPSARGTITLRGVQTVAFEGPTNVPLAWVEGAASPIGELQIRDAGRRRPLVVNRTLAEIPGVFGDTERYATSVSRFLFDPLRDLVGGQAPARLVPGGDEGGTPRAWAWNETTTCWCHTSGVVEYETVFDIENHGRSQIVLSHPTDKQIQEIRVDGVQLVAGVRETLGGETVIELPAGRRMIQLEILALATARPLIPGWQSAWSVDPVAGVIDLPVLERLWQVGVPPGLRIAHVPTLHHRLQPSQMSWSERLLGSTMRGERSEVSSTTGMPTASTTFDGFRLHAFTPTSGRSTVAGLVLVSSQLVVSAGLLLALVATLITWFFTRRSPAVAFAICGVAAVAALWAPANLVEIVRAGWWGGAFGVVLAMLGGRAVARSLVVAAACLGTPTSMAADPASPAASPLKVFVTGETDESTVLVPDRLFRELGRGSDAVETLGVRVERVAVVAAMPEPGADAALAEGGAWLLTVDLTSDSNTICTLRQPAGGGRFLPGSLVLDGSDPGELLNESVSADGRILRVPLAVPGRHRLAVRVVPAVVTAGSVGMATVGIPVAPQGGLRLSDDAVAIDVASLLLERERHGLPIDVVDAAGDASAGQFDIARADTVRLCWSLNPGGKLTREPRLVAARNDVSWATDRCRVVATFQFDPGDDSFRSFVVAADPRLTPTTGELAVGSEPVTVRRIDDTSWRVERQLPAAGRATVSVPFEMPLADPVGVFRVPEVDVVSSSAVRASRLVQFVPATGYVATTRLPAGVSAATPSELTPGSSWLAWRREPSGGLASERGAVLVTVTREPAVLRGTQRLRLDVVDERVRLRFDASLDSVDAALAALKVVLPKGWSIDRLGLARVSSPSSDSLQATSQDIHWVQSDEGVVDVIAQRPRAGRFRLDVEAREPAGGSEQGEFVVPQIEGLATTQVIVEWPTDEGLQLEAGGLDGTAAPSSSAWQSVERLPGTLLRYQRHATVVDPAANADAEPVESEDDRRALAEAERAAADEGDGAARVELLEVRFATDERGKAWGVARIDLVPTRRLVRLQLPAGLRLFEVFVDEHPLLARPVGESAWELELLDISRPRTIQVIFAGDLGDQLVSGLPLRLEPPKLAGIPSRGVLWMIRGPRGFAVRLLAPSAQVSVSEMESRREEASGRLRATLRRSLENRDPTERRRIEEQVLALLERTQLSAAEQAWNRTSLALSDDVFATTNEEGGGVIVRAAPEPTPTDSSRATATAAAILAAGIAWSLAVRSPVQMTTGLMLGGPFVALLAGSAWAALLQPAWPGVLLTVGAAGVLLRRFFLLRPSAPQGESAVVIRDSVGPHTF